MFCGREGRAGVSRYRQDVKNIAHNIAKGEDYYLISGGFLTGGTPRRVTIASDNR